VKHRYRSRYPSGMPGWGPGQGWAQPHLAGWSPLADDGSLPTRIAGSVARWWWPTLALAGFGTVAGFILGHDQPGPNLSTRGLLTIALAATVVVLLSIHRAAGPGRLARATAEYTVVALLATLLVLTGGLDQPPSNPTSSSASPEAKQTSPAQPNPTADSNQPGVLRAAAAVTRAVTKAIRAVTGAVGWLVDLWHQADATTDQPNHSPSSTTTRPTPKGEAMPSSPTPPAPTWRPL
jgi:hypothetical protein